ncbi:hypothetical protein Q8A67_021456 [Cirrhinus molitorella]|uniref:Uncharacterized protein n=1 Tax=Cirrhinus molitorella TaxID=172907 RepID=A0AA88TMT7_9TELE|nr:hypothetical protein Q8A67_021456 [Cirrhinus molitorella]
MAPLTTARNGGGARGGRPLQKSAKQYLWEVQLRSSNTEMFPFISSSSGAAEPLLGDRDAGWRDFEGEKEPELRSGSREDL